MRRLFGSRGSGSREDALLTEEAVESRARDGNLDSLVAYRKAKKQRVGKKKKEGAPEKGGDKVKGGGQTLGGFYRKTGLRNKCYRRDSEYHLVPRCPWRDTPRGDGCPISPERTRLQRPSYASTSMETPVLP